jgi:hypothetical protein
MQAPTFKDAQQAFEQAIAAGRLTVDQSSPIFAGLYMYMGTYGDLDQFKHVETRKYLK